MDAAHRTIFDIISIKALLKCYQYFQKHLAIYAIDCGVFGFYGSAILVPDGEQRDKIPDGNLITQPWISPVYFFQAHLKKGKA